MMPWFNQPSQCQPQPTLSMHHWLTKPYILTHALEQHCQQLGMQLISMQAELPLSDERDKLNLTQNETCIVRQVAFFGDNNPWTFARVIIPNTTYQAHQKAFDQLKSKPMGVNMLYNNPYVTRSTFEYSYADIHTLNECPFASQQHAYARRSLFYLQQHPILISEYFCNKLPVYSA